MESEGPYQEIQGPYLIERMRDSERDRKEKNTGFDESTFKAVGETLKGAKSEAADSIAKSLGKLFKLELIILLELAITKFKFSRYGKTNSRKFCQSAPKNSAKSPRGSPLSC